MKLKKLLTEAFEGISGRIITPQVFGKGEGFRTSPSKQIKEGPAYEYAKYVKIIEKAENQQAKAVNELRKVLDKKGLKKQSAELASNYLENARDFHKHLGDLVRSLV